MNYGLILTGIICVVCNMGCSGFQWARTNGEQLSGFSYVPIDPFPVVVDPDYRDIVEKLTQKYDDQSATYAKYDVLDILPDNAVRISVLETKSNGTVSFGSSSIGIAGNSYKVIVDYINSDTVALETVIVMSIDVRPEDFIGDFLGLKKTMFISPAELGNYPNRYPGSERYYVYSADEFDGIPTKRNLYNSMLQEHEMLKIRQNEYDTIIKLAIGNRTTEDIKKLEFSQAAVRKEAEDLWVELSKMRELIPIALLESPNLPLNAQEYSIPVYVGVGLRVVANIEVVEGKVDITGLGAIGSAAQIHKVSGTLAVQTLGINGAQVAAALPIQSELNQTTAQNAIVAVASIKTLLYDKGISKRPRVVGLYLPFRANEALVNRVLSLIARTPPKWRPTLDSIGLSEPELPRTITTTFSTN